jgi:hypothetical protein
VFLEPFNDVPRSAKLALRDRKKTTVGIIVYKIRKTYTMKDASVPP